jgi:arginine exporter protein ArgO
MSSFIEGLIAGYGIAIPVGAVAVLIINMGMRCGLKIGFSAGAGAATADVIYAIIAVVAGTALADLLVPIAPWLRFFSGLILLGMGVWGLWKGLKHANRNNKTAEICGPVRMFGQFLGITIVNPLTIVYFVALILGSSSTALTLADRTTFIMGVGIASLSWQTLLAGIGAIGHKQLSPRFQVVAIIFGNIVVILLGLRILVNISF